MIRKAMEIANFADAEKLLAAAGISTKWRPEQVPPVEWLKLFDIQKKQAAR